MYRFLVLIPLFVVFGCTLGGNDYKSKWKTLKQAESIECTEWPQRPQDLSISEIKSVRAADGAVRGFIVKGLNRKGANSNYFTSFDGDTDLDSDDFIGIQAGRSERVIGGMHRGSALAGVLTSGHNSSKFEIRQIQSNVVTHTAKFKTGRLASGDVFDAGRTAWLTLSTVDESAHLARVQSKGAKFDTKQITDLKFDYLPKILQPLSKSEAVAIWVDGNGFKSRFIDAAGKPSKANNLNLKIKDQIESWSAIAHGAGYYLVFVDGDSLVGNADLRIVHFKMDGPTGFSLVWQKEIRIDDTHMTEPTLLSNLGQLEIAMTNWLDEESTIARYKIEGGSVALGGYAGIFAQGARIVDLFYAKRGGGSYALIREKVRSGLKFKLCKL
jgi:hypothetical protein